MTDIPLISVPAAIEKDCLLERWNLLSPERRETVAATLAQTLTSSGYTFAEWRIEAHGPDGAQPVLIFTDSRSHLDFALIPGGKLLPGYDDTQLDRYRAIYAIVERYAEEEESVALGEDVALDQPTPFASTAPCDLSRKPAVFIAPFLMATTPVLVSTSGIENTIAIPSWWRESGEEMAACHDPAPMRWETVVAVLNQYRWDVPTTNEWEWASQGGKSNLFYWGNEVPRFVVNPIAYYDPDSEEYASYAAEADARIDSEWSAAERALVTDTVCFDDVMRTNFAPDIPHLFPYANGFGLVGLLAAGEWCAASNDPNDPEPLIARGGAAAGFPWQSCHEWLLLLRAVESRLNIHTDYADWKTLRPILRLAVSR